MSYPYKPEPTYKMPEDNITMSEAIQEVFCDNGVDEYDSQLDYINPFYN